MKAKCYIGTKIITAFPEDKDGKAGYQVMYPDGYVSWSPKDVFKSAYREILPSELLMVDAHIARGAMELQQMS